MKTTLSRFFTFALLLLVPRLAMAMPTSAELEFRYAAFPDGNVGTLVYLDVLGTPVPPIEIQDGHGDTYRLNLKVAYNEAGDEFVIQSFLYRVVTKKKGTTLEELGQTEVRTPPGDRAAVRFGTDGKEPTRRGFDLDFKPSIDKVTRLPPPPPPRPEPVEEAPEAPKDEAPPVDDDEFLNGGGAPEPG
jgi:hypothetical protein